MSNDDNLALISNVAANYLRRNAVSVEQIEEVVANVARALKKASKDLEGSDVGAERIGLGIDNTTGPGIETSAAEPVVMGGGEPLAQPAVPVSKSVQREFVVCLECGLQARTLRKHLHVSHNMSPQQYRAKWNLPRDYPIVAPAYSEHRSRMARKIGLGQGGGRRKKGGRK